MFKNISSIYSETLKQIENLSPFSVDTAVVLGSGLGNFIESINPIKIIHNSSLINYPPSTVEGHDGQIIFTELFNKKILLYKGRIHFYEGYSIVQCLLPIHIAFQLGAKNLLLTNAAGGANYNFSPGDLMLITDFISIMIKKELSSVIGFPSYEIKNRLLNLPSKRLNKIIIEAALNEKIELKQGVYWYNKGPTYETPAEIKMTQFLRGDAVGMSTAHEAYYGAALGMEVSGISCITNLAAGISPVKLSHAEVTETADKVKEKFSHLIKKIIEMI